MAIKHQAIIDEVKTVLETILTSGGYYTNIGQNVFVNRVTPLAASEIPGVVLNLDSDEKLTDLTGNFEDRLLSLKIMPIVTGSTAAAADRQAVVDIRKAIGADETLDGNAITCEITADNQNLAQDADKIASTELTLTVMYRTTRFAEA